MINDPVERTLESLWELAGLGERPEDPERRATRLRDLRAALVARAFVTRWHKKTRREEG